MDHPDRTEDTALDIEKSIQVPALTFLSQILFQVTNEEDGYGRALLYLAEYLHQFAGGDEELSEGDVHEKILDLYKSMSDRAISLLEIPVLSHVLKVFDPDSGAWAMLGLTFALQVTPDGKRSVPTRQHIEAFATDRTRFVTKFRARLTEEMEAATVTMSQLPTVPGLNNIDSDERDPKLTIRLRSAEPGEVHIPGYIPGPLIIGFEDAEMLKWKIDWSLQTTANCIVSKIHDDIRRSLGLPDIKKIFLVRNTICEGPLTEYLLGTLAWAIQADSSYGRALLYLSEYLRYTGPGAILAVESNVSNEEVFNIYKKNAKETVRKLANIYINTGLPWPYPIKLLPQVPPKEYTGLSRFSAERMLPILHALQLSYDGRLVPNKAHVEAFAADRERFANNLIAFLQQQDKKDREPEQDEPFQVIVRSDYRDTIIPILPNATFAMLMLKLRDKHVDPEIPLNHLRRVQLFREHDFDQDVYPRHSRQSLKGAGVTLNEVIYARVNWDGLEKAQPETWPSKWNPGDLARPWRPMKEFGGALEQPAVGAEGFGGVVETDEGFQRSFEGPIHNWGREL